MNRLLRDLEPGNDLKIRINGNRGFQEAFPGLSRSPRPGKSGLIDSGKRDSLYPVVEQFNEPVQ